MSSSRPVILLHSNTAACLACYLRATVPPRMATLASQPFSDRVNDIDGLITEIAERGDVTNFPDGPELDAAREALAEGIALLALQPGGVDVFGQHWCTDHKTCEAAS